MSKTKEPQEATKSGGLMDDAMDFITNSISDADEVAAAKRVAKLKKKLPNISNEDLADRLIKKKCLTTGAIGAFTSGVAVIPGVGQVAALTFGSAIDIGMTFKMQAELALEIAAAYEHQFDDAEKRNTVLLVTGVGMGAHRVAVKGGEKIAQKAAEKLATQAAAKAVPFVGIGVSAGANVLTTYVVGQRGKAYFSRGPEEMEDVGDNIRAITGVDEEKIVAWLAETAEYTSERVSKTNQNIVGGVISVSEKSGELAVITVDKTKQSAKAVSSASFKGIAAIGNTTSNAASSVKVAIAGWGTGTLDTLTGVLSRDKPEKPSEDDETEKKAPLIAVRKFFPFGRGKSKASLVEDGDEVAASQDVEAIKEKINIEEINDSEAESILESIRAFFPFGRDDSETPDDEDIKADDMPQSKVWYSFDAITDKFKRKEVEDEEAGKDEDNAPDEDEETFMGNIASKLKWGKSEDEDEDDAEDEKETKKDNAPDEEADDEETFIGNIANKLKWGKSKDEDEDDAEDEKKAEETDAPDEESDDEETFMGNIANKLKWGKSKSADNTKTDDK
ncbi:MAG TPA: hypothetical protein G4N96_05815 [Chloroflexi bacterium]|nr:hypothetical protein [Chloroflexota bacterium]